MSSAHSPGRWRAWLQDVPLLGRLVAEKLSTEAVVIAAEGWKWVEVATDFPYGHTYGLRRLTGTTFDLTEAERAEREALRDEFDALQAEYEGADEFPDAVDARLGEIEAALEAFDNRPLQFDADQMAHAGVFISLRADGTLSVERGYVRLEDEEPVEPVAGEAAPDSEVASDSVITTPWQPPAEDEEDDGIRPLPDRLLSELTAYRTLALRDAVARNPDVALTALLHRLVSDTFHHRNTRGCLQASVQHVYLPSHAEGLNDSPAAQSIAERHEGWEADLPGDDAALWDWLAALDSAKADLDTPRRAMGALLGHGVRFGQASDVLAAGEGIETVLSLRMVLPRMPVLAALSAGHLSAIQFPEGPWPLTMIPVEGTFDPNNAAPPTVALFALALVQLGLVLSMRAPVTRTLARPRVWTPVALLGARLMTLFLWHQVAMVVITNLAAQQGWLPLTEEINARWWVQQPLWVAVFALALAVMAVLVGRFETADEDAAPDCGGWGSTVPGIALTGGAIAGFLWLGVAELPVWPALGSLALFLAGFKALRPRG